LISVSLAPKSYFLSAAETLVAANRDAAITVAHTGRLERRIFIVVVSPWECINLPFQHFSAMADTRLRQGSP
jgi:hypothetical protein